MSKEQINHWGINEETLIGYLEAYFYSLKPLADTLDSMLAMVLSEGTRCLTSSSPLTFSASYTVCPTLPVHHGASTLSEDDFLNTVIPIFQGSSPHSLKGTRTRLP